MAGVSILLDDEHVRQLLGRIDRAADRPRGAMEKLGNYFAVSSQLNIERETSPEGTPWPKLSPRTANARISGGRRGFGNMLRVNNHLYSSISYVAGDSSVEWGSSVPYARIHQLGGTIDMPARPGKVSIKSIRGKGNRFVRAKVKDAEERKFNRRAHQVRIPARPYLGVSAADREAAADIVADFIRAEAGA